MPLLTNPNELDEGTILAGLIFGQPGVGKSTLALSAPSPVLVDADGGLKRVEKRFQVPSLQIKSYREFLALLESPELDPFETIVTDTLGRFVDLIGDYVCEENPKNRQGDGTLALKGYGAVKAEFQRMLRIAKTKGKHLLFVAHEKEEKDGETRIMRPDVTGGSGKDLVKDLDFMGYMEMRGSKRTISFSPNEKYYAKNSLNLPSVMEIPEPKSAAENTFIQDNIIKRSMDRLKSDAEENKKYEDLVANLKGFIATVKDAKSADEALATIVMAPVIWDSERVAKFTLFQKAKELSLFYDKDAKCFKVSAPITVATTAEPTPEDATVVVAQTTGPTGQPPQGTLLGPETQGQANNAAAVVDEKFDAAKAKSIRTLKNQTSN